MDQLKSKLGKIHLSNYPGENVQKMNVNINAKCDHLHTTEYWGKDIFHAIAKKYKSSKCE
eukprot:5773132-Ditylum_brightwellii.AAC.1